MFSLIRLPRHSNGRRGSRLHSREQSIWQSVARDSAIELRQRLSQGRNHHIRQGGTEIAERQTRLIGALDAAVCGTRLSGKKILQPLNGGSISASTQLKGASLPMPLEGHPSQGVA